MDFQARTVAKGVEKNPRTFAITHGLMALLVEKCLHGVMHFAADEIRVEGLKPAGIKHVRVAGFGMEQNGFGTLSMGSVCASRRADSGGRKTLVTKYQG